MSNIISKIDSFIKNYHRNLLLKNMLFFGIYFISLILLLSFIEHLVWFSSSSRKVILFAALLFILFMGIYWLLLPFIKLTKFSKKIDRKTAADIIGKFFPEISDKFRNILELNDILNVSRENIALLEAAIEQKSSKFSNYNLNLAINKSNLYKAFFVFISTFGFLLALYFVNPIIISGSINRITNFNTTFTKPAPFEFILHNKTLSSVQGENIEILLSLEGNRVPAEAKIIIENNEFNMVKIDRNKFSYQINNLNESFNFKFKASDYFSSSYKFNVFSKPKISGFAVELVYPSYLQKQPEVIQNITNLTVPQGTSVRWSFSTAKADQMFVVNNKQKVELTQNTIKKHVFQFSTTIHSFSQFLFSVANQEKMFSDSLYATVDVIKDLYPVITFDQKIDSLLPNKRFFKGSIADDYGFTSFYFYYKAINEKNYTKVPIPFNKNILEQEYFYFFNFSDIPNWKESSIQYFFEVSDNDGVNGPKSTRTQEYIFEMPSESEINELYSQKNLNLNSNISSALNRIQKLQQGIEQFRMDMMNKKNISWEDRNLFNKLLEEQAQVEKTINEIQMQNLEKNIFEDFMKDIPLHLLEKQLKLEQMFNDLFSEEMKKQMQELQRLLQELNRDKIMDQLERIQLRSEDLEEQLDRNLSLMKQLEFEKQINSVIDEIEKLNQQVENLSKHTSERNTKDDELKKLQDSISNSHEKLKESLESLKNKNSELEDPLNLPDVTKKADEISKNINESAENLQRGRRGAAVKSQNQASDQLQELSSQLQDALNQMEEENLAEDIENLKIILKNLLLLSFQQESTLELGKRISSRDPNYGRLLSSQKSIQNRFQVVKDSLNALAKRQIDVQGIVNKDLKDIEANFSRVDHHYNFGDVNSAVLNQQSIMKSFNNLALLLAESLEDMNNRMSQMKGSGKPGQCKNASQGKGKSQQTGPSPRTMRQLQDQLNQNMEQLLKRMVEGSSGSSGSSLSEEFAKMAAQQEAIRQQLQQYSEQLKSMGEHNNRLINEMMQKMEQTERELVNRQLSQQTLNRQKDISIRLMESERADLEREKDDKRTSRTAKFIQNRNQETISEFRKETTSQIETFRKVPTIFSSFYRQKVDKFFNNLNN